MKYVAILVPIPANKGDLGAAPAASACALNCPAVAIVSLANGWTLTLGIDPKSTVLLILSLLVATLSLGTRFVCCVEFAPMNKEPFRFCYVFNSCLRTCYLDYRHFLLMLFNQTSPAAQNRPTAAHGSADTQTSLQSGWHRRGENPSCAPHCRRRPARQG